MNKYRFDEIQIGLTESFEVNITEEQLAAFGQITGDYNPLHSSEEFAREKGFPGKVAYGMLTASFLSTLAGVYLPGEDSLIHSIEIKFTKPVLVGDVLLITGEVKEKNEHFPVFSMNVTLRNQKGEKVLRGTMKVGVIDGQ